MVHSIASIYSREKDTGIHIKMFLPALYVIVKHWKQKFIMR